jgi:SOS-response transcriptional repressor LexA
MHVLQQRILDLSQTTNLADLTLREIGERVGDKYPQKIKHHIEQLYKKGFLRQNADGSVIFPTGQTSSDLFYTLPIVGSANCGKAVTFADEHIEGYLTLSKKLLDSHSDRMFVVRAIGNSMNMANIQGDSIDDGDYVIIDATQKPVDSYYNQYVLSTIDGMANIKKLSADTKKNIYILLSQSSEEHPPIYLHKDDVGSYLINGAVTKVIKRPNA